MKLDIDNIFERRKRTWRRIPLYTSLSIVEKQEETILGNKYQYRSTVLKFKNLFAPTNKYELKNI
jgi:hypothetical protein